MIIEVDTKEFKNALERIMVKGKYITTKGYSSSNAGENAILFLEKVREDKLVLINGDATFIVRFVIDPLEIADANYEPFVINIKDTLDFVKSFKEDNLHLSFSEGKLNLSCGSKVVQLPTFDLNNLPQLNGVFNMKNNILNYEFREIITEETPYPQFMKKNFESVLSINNKQFTDVLKSCELVGSGIFKLNVKNGVSFSSTTALKNYTESLEVVNKGESTIMFTGPLYSFFDKEQELNIYSKDEFPLLIVSEDRQLIRAPRTDGD